MSIIHVYMMMKNEIQMLPFFLRHYEKFADKIFVWDDHSADGSKELLEKHPLVTLVNMPFTGIDDDYSRLHFYPHYKYWSRQKADWVMCVDVDEFVYHPQLKEQLELFKKEDFDLAWPVGFLMMADSFPTDKGQQIWEEVKYGLRDPLMDKPVIFRPEIDIIFGGGRHRTATLEAPFRSDGLVRKRRRTGIQYLHYRFFGINNYIERIRRDCERMYLSGSEYGKRFWPFSESMSWKMPDKTKASPRKWFAQNAHRIIQVIE